MISTTTAQKTLVTFAIRSNLRDYSELWTESAERKCRQFGFDLQLPDTEQFDNPCYWQEFLQNTEAVITTWGSPKFDGELLAHAKNLRIIAHAAGSVAGYVDHAALAQHGVKLVSANEQMAHSVAEWCMLSSLMGVRNINDYLGVGRDKKMKWEYNRPACGSLYGKRIGIWGYGAIAEQYVKMLAPFNVGEIVVTSSHLTPEAAAIRGMRKVELEELFSTSDIIQVLTGLNSKTLNRIGADILASIKDGAVLVNGGRAGLINESALLAELRKGRFTGVFDVFHEEPLPCGNELFRLDNVLLTPHNAGFPSRGTYVELMLDEIAAFFDSRPLTREVATGKISNMTHLIKS